MSHASSVPTCGGRALEFADHPGTERELSPAERLWIAVLIQAVHDARRTQRSFRVDHERALAIQFLAGEDGVLQIICRRLNLEPDYIIREIRQLPEHVHLVQHYAGRRFAAAGGK